MTFKICIDNVGYLLTYAMITIFLLLFFATVLFESPLMAFNTDPRPDIIIVTIDTLRPDHLGCYGYAKNTSPVLDEFSGSALVFEDAYTVIPLTTPSHASLFTSLYPRAHGALTNSSRMIPATQTMAGFLSAQGYETAAFVSGMVLNKRTNLNMGFKFYFDLTQHDRPERPLHPDTKWPSGPDSHLPHPRSMQRPAQETMDVVFNWFKTGFSQRKPLFLWTHFYDPHQPYNPPEPFGEKFTAKNYKGRSPNLILNPNYDIVQDTKKFAPRRRRLAGPHKEMPLSNITPEEIRHLIALYDGEIASVDYQLGRFFSLLKEKGIFDNAIIMVLGDHGEILYEHRKYFGHHHYLYNGSLRIPLIIKIPGTKPKRIPERVSILDVFPTLLEVLDMSHPAALSGTSFLQLLNGGKGTAPKDIYLETLKTIQVPHDKSREASPELKKAPRKYYAERGILSNQWKLIYPETDETNVELYNTAKDPDETRNLASQNKELVFRLKGKVTGWIETFKQLFPPINSPSPKEIERLKSLGYL